MKKYSRLVLFLFVISIQLIAILSCNLQRLPEEALSVEARTLMEDPIEPIMVDKKHTAGKLTITQSEEAITLSFEVDESYLVKEVRLWIGTDVNAVPHNKGGLILGKFSKIAQYDTGTRLAVISVPNNYEDGQQLVLFPCLTLFPASGAGEESTAFVGSKVYTGIKRWNYYFSYQICSAKYSIVYNGNGAESGTAPIDLNEYSRNSSILLPKNTGNLYKSGYRLSGWSTSPDGTGAVYAMGTSYSVSSDTTLYAIWIKSIADMIPVTGGSYLMGSPGELGFEWERPVHTVTVDDFEISKYEITQQQFLDVMGYNPSFFIGDTLRPVEQITWYDAVLFCNALSQKEDLEPVYNVTSIESADNQSVNNAIVEADKTKNGYRLPYEAEWEYAARGGSQSLYDYLYSGSDNPSLVAWYDEIAGRTHRVGYKLPNALGLYDMSGNVMEYCWDYFCEYPADNSPNDSLFTSTYRVFRGGAFANSEFYLRVSYRYCCEGSFKVNGLGFRIARNK